MNKPALNLVVIRSKDLKVSRAFYEAIGLSFDEEQHHLGPIHLVEVLGEVVFEIYPWDGITQDDTPRLGFQVDSIINVIESLGESAKLIRAPGKVDGDTAPVTAVLEDPDGHKVDLTQRS